MKLGRYTATNTITAPRRPPVPTAVLLFILEKNKLDPVKLRVTHNDTHNY